MIENGTDELVGKLSDHLDSFIAKNFTVGSFELISSEYYWKVPSDKEVVFQVNDKSSHGVSRFIKFFPLHWTFIEDSIFVIQFDKTFFNERAIWSKLNNPEEVFLIPEVSWANIYTWPEEK